MTAPTWPRHQVDEDDGGPEVWNVEVEAAEDSAVRIVPGEYSARVVRAAVRPLFNTRRVELVMEIVQSKAAGTRLSFICLMPPKARKHSRFMRAWELANGGPARRRDRLSLKVFRSRLFRVAVRDVTVNRFQRKLARPYSIISELLEREA